MDVRIIWFKESRWVARYFAEFRLSAANVLSMTGLDPLIDEELSRSFELCLKVIIQFPPLLYTASLRIVGTN
jgi:hypothetical protein